MLPHLIRRQTHVDLIVGGQPTLLIGGELRNSSASTLDFMEPLWPRLTAMNLNTLLVPFSWRQFEPDEGRYDDRLLVGLIERARREGLRLALLWLATWKNGVSGYAPTWMLSDPVRFPRMSASALSPLGPETVAADCGAFTRLMETVRRCDPDGDTVILVQVENEVGLLGASRDRSPLAEAAFQSPVPALLTEALAGNEAVLDPVLREAWVSRGRRHGEVWSSVFGDGELVDEVFMAWQFGRYIEQVAGAGKRAHPLPMFVNAWTVDPADPHPGVHPSGGPVARMLDVWMAAAPSIDLYGVDNYRADFPGECAAYRRRGNPLFLPEAAGWWGGDTPQSSAAKAFYALGNGALCYSPFGVDNALYAGHPLREAYGVLRQLEPLLLAARGGAGLRGFYRRGQEQIEAFQIGEYNVTIRYALAAGANQMFETGLAAQEAFGAYGLIVQEAPDLFVVAGRGFQADFASRDETRPIVLNLAVEEGGFFGGGWKAARVLNGDEVPDQGTGGVRLPPGACPVFGEPGIAIQRLRLLRMA